MDYQDEQQKILFSAQEHVDEIEDQDLENIAGAGPVVSAGAMESALHACSRGERATLVRSGSGNHVISWPEYYHRPSWPTPSFSDADTIGPEMVGLPAIAPGQKVLNYSNSFPPPPRNAKK